MSKVFVVERARWFGGAWPQGFVALAELRGGSGPELLRAFGRDGHFVDRPAAEADPSQKQCIPYCVLRCGPFDPTDERASGVFVTVRSRGQSEARLHHAHSIGLGGHVEPEDELPEPDGAAFFAAALLRELREELWLPERLPAPQLCGLVNDDSTEVGSVHTGLVYTLDLPLPLAAAREQVGVREIAKMEGRWTSLVEFRALWQTPTRFESWSQFVIEAGTVGAMGGRSWHGPTAVIRSQP